jgi:hypothetical protein
MKNVFLIIVAIAAVGFTNVCRAQQQIEKVTYNLSSIYSGDFAVEIEAKSVSINWGDSSKIENFAPNGKMKVIHHYNVGKNRKLVISATRLTKLHLFGNQNEFQTLRRDDRIPFYRDDANRFNLGVYVEKYYGLESVNFMNCINLSELGIGYLPMLKSINCSTLPALKTLWARHLEFIREVDISKNNLLKCIVLADDVMPENNIDFKNNLLLEYLLIEDFECPSLDISQNIKLKYLEVEGVNKLKQIKFATGYPSLKSIVLYQTLLTASDLNSFFRILSTKNKSDCVFINLRENFGDDECNRTIATAKGYSFSDNSIGYCANEENYMDEEEYPCVNCPKSEYEEYEEVVVESVAL